MKPFVIGIAGGTGSSKTTVARRNGIPADRTSAVADLSAATDLLDRRVKRERIPAVVRRPAAGLYGLSLLDLAFQGRHAEVRNAVGAMFDLRRVQP